MNRKTFSDARTVAFVWAILSALLLACACGSKAGQSCASGTAACACAAGNTCNGNLICNAAGNCVNPDDDNGPPPEHPVCYTPCSQGYTDANGTYFACSVDGLMARCLDGAQCVDGTCVATHPVPVSSAKSDAGTPAPSPAPTAAPGTCTGNVECPDYQVCIEGKCYSNCEYDSDCSSPKKCYRKSCRTPCTSESGAAACPSGTYCSVVDAESGYCLPLAKPEADAGAQTTVEGTFSVSVDQFKFSNSHIQQAFKLVNHGPKALEFTVTKVEHTEYSPTGITRVLTNPMPWLSIGKSGQAAKVNTFKSLVDGNDGELDLEFANDPMMPSKWEGTVEVSNPELGTRKLSLGYAAGADGRWSGTAYYFAQFGDLNLDDWIANREDNTKLGRVGNAFLQRWGAMRRGRITLDEMNAVLTATSQGSWTWPSVKSICPTAACYLYSNSEGYGRYSNSLDDQPVPSGVSELPIAFDLRATDATHLEGRIVSQESLHYSADPALKLEFESDPAVCGGENSSACLGFLKSLDAHVVVGGRYHATSQDTGCAQAGAGFQLVKTPWLLPGFQQNTEADSSGTRYSFECRDTVQPFGTSDPKNIAVNVSLAQANPIPDGVSRKRHLELVDGALINQDTMYVIFRERFEESFLGITDTKGFAAYGVAVLKRSVAQLDASAYVGTAQTETRTSSVELGASVGCSSDLLRRVLGSDAGLSQATVKQVLTTTLDGVASDASVSTVPVSQVHYLCHDTGLFDQGALTSGVPAACPAESDVTYFYFADPSQAVALPTLSCQRSGNCKNDLPSLQSAEAVQKGNAEVPPACPKPGNCEDVLTSWKGSGLVAVDPVTRCKDPNQINCDSNRTNLTVGKQFLLPVPGQAVFSPLTTEIDNAFRYKTRFRNRSGQSVGFAPQICVPDANSIPYCYDPGQIEEIRERVDCLTQIYSQSGGAAPTLALEPPLRERLRQYLTTNFSYDQRPGPSTPITYDGFEKLNAELLVMLGDDAYTQAFQSRFDLANSALVSFEGSKFEPNGIDLSGVAGYEMYTLYQASQYYQTALDRFYELSPFIWRSVSAGGSENYIGQETVVSYFDRLMRASTQKSRTWSEIGKRYQSFNRPDLARAVAEREYTSAYLESIVLARMMQSVVDVSATEDRAQIRRTIDASALSYRAALLDMRNVYSAFTDQTNNFGFPPDYVPFPELQPNGPNAFVTLLAAAKQSELLAAQKEELAINANRSFETDSAAFQSELTRIRSTYENQLADVCGTFTGSDGQVYPAIQTYAYLDDRAKLLGDPCGLMGNGSLDKAMTNMESSQVDIEAIRVAYDKVFSLIQIEQERVASQCQAIVKLADYQWTEQGKVNDLQTEIDTTRLTVDALTRELDMVKNVADLSKCSVGTSSDCPSAAVSIGVYLAAGVGSMVAQNVGEADVSAKQEQIADIQRDEAQWQTLHQCDVAQIDSNAKVKEYLLQLKDIDLNALKTQYSVRLALSDIQKLRNDAARIEAEEAESQQLSINVEAAKNDPNVRIYKNDAVLNADRTFTAATKAAYQATKVFEYYTSQSYAKLQDLSLVRLVAHGDYNLENYLSELEDAYSTFSETFGHPDTRVQVLSLRDDILKIPQYGPNRQVLTQSERVDQFRQALTDTRLLDARGYIVIPFATDLTELSPLTRNHKVLYVESEIVGSDVGDNVGRVYLDQDGTGVIFSVDDSKAYFRFPSRVAVVNPFFNGARAFTPDVYRNDRLRDRPLVNTHWQFVLNQRDEAANQDINLNALSDIRLFVYYTDFTAL